MSQHKSTKCYIEEYDNDRGQLSARLREKGTGRKVDLGITAASKQHFLRFLSGAHAQKAVLPGLFSKGGDAEDCIVVSGDLDFDAPDEIRFIYNEKLSYLIA